MINIFPTPLSRADCERGAGPGHTWLSPNRPADVPLKPCRRAPEPRRQEGLRPGGRRCGATFFSRERDSGYHSDTAASVPVPGGILLLGFGRAKARGNAEPVIPGPPGLWHSRTSWFRFHGSAADSSTSRHFYGWILCGKDRAHIFS